MNVFRIELDRDARRRARAVRDQPRRAATVIKRNACQPRIRRAVGDAQGQRDVGEAHPLEPQRTQREIQVCIERAQAQGLTGDEAIMSAFEENARDLSRVGGN